MAVGLLGNKSPDSNRFTLVTPKSENDVRLQATLGNQNPIGLPVGVVRFFEGILVVEMDGFFIFGEDIKFKFFNAIIYSSTYQSVH